MVPRKEVHGPKIKTKSTNCPEEQPHWPRFFWGLGWFGLGTNGLIKKSGAIGGLGSKVVWAQKWSEEPKNMEKIPLCFTQNVRLFLFLWFFSRAHDTLMVLIISALEPHEHLMENEIMSPVNVNDEGAIAQTQGQPTDHKILTTITRAWMRTIICHRIQHKTENICIQNRKNGKIPLLSSQTKKSKKIVYQQQNQKVEIKILLYPEKSL